MAWPTPQDYNEAIQNPSTAFADSELRDGSPELTGLGLPRAITGGFASVYKVQCRMRTWAVRCFLRQFHDHEHRYAAISEHLTRVRPAYTVGFTFLRDGIRVRGQWYPILKMEWVQGEPLNCFIERHLGNRSSLLDLAKCWFEMVTALRQASIAHGDLQHGNVLVVDGQLRLIDYDGMYVPALLGQSSHEVGHRNYQHPLRTESDFGPYLDNFSAWVVFVSLISLANDPGLWRQFRCGDECLLFRRRDFEKPEASDVLRALERHPNQEIRSVAAVFRRLLNFDPRDVPSLDGGIAQIAVLKDRERTNNSGWIHDHIKSAPVAMPVDTPSATNKDVFQDTLPADPSWILDFTVSNSMRPVSFKNSAAPELLLLAFSAILILVLLRGIPGQGSWLLTSLLMGLLNVAVWIYRFHSDPSTRERRNLTRKLRDVVDGIGATDRHIKAFSRDRAKIQEDKTAAQACLTNERQTLRVKEGKEILALENSLQSGLLSLKAQRQALSKQEADALRRIKDDIGVKVAALNARIAELNQAEITELNRRLQAKQREHIDDYLRRFRLESASIQGIGPAFKERLVKAGFCTAADVNFYRVQRVRGIGSARARSLAYWRDSIEAEARKTMPSALSHIEAAAIRARYDGQRRALEQQRDSHVQHQKKEEDRIRAQYRPFLEQLDREEHKAKEKNQALMSGVRARYAQQYHEIRERESALEHDTASKLEDLQEKIRDARSAGFRLQLQAARLRQQLRGYDGLRFAKYVERVLLGWTAA